MFHNSPEAMAIGALCVWRVTHLLHAEAGPFDAAATLRRAAGEGFWGRALGCFYCLSLWVALPVGLTMSAGLIGFLLAWTALSGAACLLEQATRRAALADFIHEEQEGL